MCEKATPLFPHQAPPHQFSIRLRNPSQSSKRFQNPPQPISIQMHSKIPSCVILSVAHHTVVQTIKFKIAQSKRLSSTDKYYRVCSVHIVFVAHLIFPFVFQICPIYISIFSVAGLIFPFGLPFALHNMSCQGLALDDLFHILQNIPTS